MTPSAGGHPDLGVVRYGKTQSATESATQNGIDNDRAVNKTTTTLQDLVGEWCNHMEVDPQCSAAILNIAQAEAKVKRHAEDIHQTWRDLNHIVLTRENVIRRRWTAKKPSKRRELLLTTWPNMPERHRSEFVQTMRRYASLHKSFRFDDESIFKYPYINLEDFSQIKPILLLLNSRARHLPHIFARADQEACRLGREMYGIRVAYLIGGYKMLLSGQKSKETYGRLVKDTGDDTTGAALDPTSGLLVLEVQSRLLRFLLDCCYRILHDIPQDALLDRELPISPEPEPITTKDTSYAELSTVALELAYRVPRDLEPDQLLNLVRAKASQIADHLCDLREDPGYFPAIVQGYAELERDESGSISPKADDFAFWSHTVSRAAAQAYTDWTAWDALEKTLVDLVNVLDVSNACTNSFLKASLREGIPTTLANAVRMTLVIISSFCQQLRAAHSCSSKGDFSLEELDLGSWLERNICKATPSAGDNEMFTVAFAMLCNMQKIGAQVLGIWNFTEEVGHMLAQKPSFRKHISPFVYNLFSDLALVVHVFKEIVMSSTWSTHVVQSRKVELRPLEICQCSQGVEYLTKKLSKHFATLETAGTMPHLIPLTSTFHYPVEKPRSESTVNALRRAETNLDELWRAIDEGATDYPGVTLHDLFLLYDPDARHTRRTPPWLPLPVQSSSETISEKDDPTVSNLASQPEKPGRWRYEQPRHKIKTRGPSTSAEPQVGRLLHTPTSALEFSGLPTKFELKDRALKVFNTLFHTQSSDAPKREVCWDDFRYAMRSVGFVGEKLYGSVWHFVPGENHVVTQSIHFHEPHPANKLTFHVARRIGRRLNRRYGWTGEMFTLQK
ncbi:hypothetical protein H2200_001117 [Cladophialophora chaetospira]|uniref:Clr5 domain-containing protein n=1 Tax=Cladophialophora chaetospira TaxID=386627 RepID=A0AA38XL80_9EURO|nr:hypothetical protein H2200_001117 [Cladophialophora chaetospira]